MFSKTGASFYGRVDQSGAKFVHMESGTDLGLLILRLSVGFTFFYHGVQKLFGWYGGPGLEKASGVMESMGFVPGKRNAFLAGLTESLGGLLLFFGLFTPVGAMFAFSVMVVATFAVHFKNGFGITNRGYEYNFVLAFTALCTAFTGPGKYSIDSMMNQNYGSVTFGISALLLGSIGAGVQLAMRKAPKPPAV